jgi:hypothetical protein
MVAPSQEEFWMNCVLTSQSASKVLFLTNANLEILDIQKVQMLQRVDLGGFSHNLLEEADPMASAIRLDPGETYECIFKIKSKEFNGAQN